MASANLSGLHGVRFLMDGRFARALVAIDLYNALLALPDLLLMRRLLQPLVQVDTNGASGLVVIAESHIAIHQFEDLTGTVDVSTCRADTLNRSTVKHYLQTQLGFRVALERWLPWELSV